jgi:glyoxylase-like metal-dependent hydrolase (beta-lactamase superfamily II)
MQCIAIPRQLVMDEIGRTSMIGKASVLIAGFLISAGVVAGPSKAVSRYASSEAGFAVNSWLVPTGTGLVVIDTQFTVSEADKLADAVIATDRPLRAMVITHPHPDHYNGTCRLLKIARVPVYATQSTIDVILATAEAKRAQWKPTYGKDYPDETCFPDRALPASGRVTVDGLELRSRDYGPGEASTESVVLVPRLKAAFVGDLIYSGVHPWLAEGRSAQWLLQLDRLSHDVPVTWTVFPGHGPAGDSSLISAQREYIVGFRAALQRGISTENHSKEATQVVVDDFRNRYPHWLLETLIPLNAVAVAKELAGRGAP